MKKNYVEFLKIYVLELVIGVLIDYYKIHIKSNIVDAIVALLLILPMLLFLYFAGKDQNLDTWKRYASKFFFGFIIFGYIGSSIAELVAYMIK